MGAAQQTFTDITGATDPTIATAYAVAYPLGVVGIILTLVLFRYIFKINIDKEKAALDSQSETKLTEANIFSLVVENPAIVDKPLHEIKKLIEKEFVISRVLHVKSGELVVPKTTLSSKRTTKC